MALDGVRRWLTAAIPAAERVAAEAGLTGLLREEMLLLGECMGDVSGGEGKVIAANILGKPGESGC